jgi:hypothetical protein
MRFITGVFLFLLAFMPLHAATDFSSIAINDFLAKGIEQSDADLITDRLRGELIKTGFFKVMERTQMKEILKEQGFQKGGLCDESGCLVEMGKLLGVKRMITGSVGKIGTVHTLSLRMFDVETGEIIQSINEDCSCPVEEVLLKSTVSVAEKLKAAICAKVYGKLSVSTVPSKASITLDGKDRGITPFSDDMLSHGKYSVTVKHSGYESVSDSLVIQIGETVERTYTLQHTTVFNDSVFAYKKNVKRKRFVLRQSIIGFVSCGFLGGGVACQYFINKEIREKNRLKEEYVNAPDGGNFEYYKQQIGDIDKTIKQYKIIRNLCYPIAGAGGIAFTLSFFF